MNRRRDYLNDPAAPAINSLVPAASVVVIGSAGRVLLLKRADNELWALPGGAMQPGETIADAAVREAKEETNVNVEIIGLVGIYTDPSHVIAYTDGEVRQEFNICFKGRTSDQVLSRNSESVAVRFVPQEELHRLAMHPRTRIRLEHALDATRVSPYIG